MLHEFHSILSTSIELISSEKIHHALVGFKKVVKESKIHRCATVKASSCAFNDYWERFYLVFGFKVSSYFMLSPFNINPTNIPLKNLQFQSCYTWSAGHAAQMIVLVVNFNIAFWTTGEEFWKNHRFFFKHRPNKKNLSHICNMCHSLGDSNGSLQPIF